MNGLLLDTHTMIWFGEGSSDKLSVDGFRLIDLNLDIALESSLLPGQLHADPADRMLIATARHHNLLLATRDKKIIAYGETGHVGVLAV